MSVLTENGFSGFMKIAAAAKTKRLFNLPESFKRNCFRDNN